MEKKDLTQSIISEIKEQRVQPKPRWHFLLHEWVLWILGLLSVLVGGLAMSIIFVQIRLIDWDVFDIVGGGGILQIIPYLWLLLLAGFILLAQYQIRHTKKGYQYSVAAVVFMLVSFSLFLGSLFYHLRIGYKFHRHLSQNSDLYQQLADRKSALWNNPDEGRLGGTLVEQVNEEEFLLLDEAAFIWTVKFNGNDLPKNPPVSRGVPEDAKLRILGDVTGDAEFTATEILPWLPPRNPFEKGARKERATKLNELRTK